MADIGEPTRFIVVEPIENPVPEKPQPVNPTPVKEPEPEKVPDHV